MTQILSRFFSCTLIQVLNCLSRCRLSCATHYSNYSENYSIIVIIISSDRSSYSDDGLLYIYPQRQLFQIFTQSIDAIAVTSVTLSHLTVSMQLISQDIYVTGYFGDIFEIFLEYFWIFWGYFGDIFGIFWRYFGDILGIFW